MKKLFLGSILVGMGFVLSTAALAQAGGAQLKAISVPSTMVSGHVRLGHVQLNEVTPSDVSVALSSTAGASVNSSVTVAAGDAGADFPIRAAAVSIEADVTVSASLNTTTMSGPLKVLPASMVAFIATQYVVGGTSGYGAIFLNGQAGDHASVELASSNAALYIHSPLLIAEGNENAAFGFATRGVNHDTDATLSAKYRGITLTRVIHIYPAHEAGILLTPSNVTGGHMSYGHVFLKGNAGPGGDVITLGSNNKVAVVPDSVKVPQGEDEAFFPIKTHGVDTEADATITATFDGISRSAVLNVEPAALDRVAVPANIIGGNEGMAGVVLDGAAGPSGVTVTLSSDSGVLRVPSSVKIAPDTWSKAFVFITHGVDVVRSATITATAGDVSKTGTVMVHPATLIGITAAPMSVVGGKPVRLEVGLNGKAGEGGATVALSSDSPSVIAVPASLKINEGDFAAGLLVTTKAVHAITVVTISATYEGVTKKVAITVHPA